MKIAVLPAYVFASLFALSIYPLDATTYDFNDVSIGNTDRDVWSETWMTDSNQQNLYSVEDGVGYQGTPGLSLDTELAASSYRILNQFAMEGERIELSARFRVELNDTPPLLANHPLVSLYISNESKWYTGQRVDFMLVRRSSLEHPDLLTFGVMTQLDKGNVTGWIEGPRFGLPSAPPKSGNTTSSDWFTMKMELTAASGGLWDLRFLILDEEAEMIEGFQAAGVKLPNSFVAGQPLYGGVSLGWIKSNENKVLKDGGVSGLFIDDISVVGE